MYKIKNITLDVYSSNEIYGSEFADKANKDTEDLFEQAKKLPNVNYIGYKPNEYILRTYLIMIYLYIHLYLKKHFVLQL